MPPEEYPRSDGYFSAEYSQKEYRGFRYSRQECRDQEGRSYAGRDRSCSSARNSPPALAP